MKNPGRRVRGAAPAIVVAVLLAVGAVLPLAAAEGSNAPFLQVIPRLEVGYVGILKHIYQSGPAGSTRFDFVTQGGQDILFPYQRFTAEVLLGARNRVSLLYQPLTIDTRTVADRNGSNGGVPVVVDDASFAPGTPIDITYGFDFWRLSWLFDFAKSPDTILGAGLSLQLRNASIVFTSVDAATAPAERSVQQNVGPVPIIKVRAAHWFTPRLGRDFEADGFYASSSFFNGATRPFTGWVWDGALAAKARVAKRAVASLTVRSIGGGASGTNAYDFRSATTNVGGETYNELATLALVLGFSIE